MANNAPPLNGLVIDYILVTSPVLNVNFGDPAYPKSGPSAIGQGAGDFWNLSDTKFNQGTVTFSNLWGSDSTPSTVDLTVQNAPGLWGNGVLDDIMYHHYVYSWNAQPVIVRLADMPSDVYDLYVYGHSPGDTGNGLYRLKKNGVEIGHRGTTIWGHLWASTNWTEGEQYVVFRDIPVAPGDTLEITVQPVNTYPILAGIQLVPSGAVVEPQPDIQQLINVDVVGTQGAKTGFAAVGQTANDVWNLYQKPGSTHGVLQNLSYANGNPSGAGLIVQNAPGWWSFPTPPGPIDPMYNGYAYPFNGGNISVSLTNLANGIYGFYVYGHAEYDVGNSVVNVVCGGVNYGTRGTTVWGNGWASADWQDGQQYVSLRGVRVLGGSTVQLTISPYGDYYTQLNGLQIVKLVDGDRDGLPDDWELQYFGNFDQTGTGDPDGDGLSNLGEYKAGLHPLDFDTDGDGIPDGREDSDGDGLTNAGEMTTFGSNPGNAYTFNPVKSDAEYLFTARAGESAAMVDFDIYPPVGGVHSITIFGADADAVYDLYFVNNFAAQRWQWRRVLADIKCNSAGEAMFQIRQPDPNQGYFVILSAADTDGDGLTDGYEAWFNYNGLRTVVDDFFTDLDAMADGWEVEYGLNPTVATGNDGDNGNPDGDTYFNGSQVVPLANRVEHDFYVYYDGSYDPLKVVGTAANRPVVSVFAGNPTPFCEEATFTIYRYAGSAANYSTPLTVYYSVGGTLSHDNGDYSITPAPSEWPRIYSATIPANEQWVNITMTAPGVSASEDDVQTIVVAITPYAVAPVGQVQNPSNWGYVVDWHQNRATATFYFDHLRPVADAQSLQTCRNTDLPITLTGNDWCPDDITFALVPGSGPSHGVLIDNSPPELVYRPAAGYEGPDSFQFVASDGLRDSAPATILIEVGSPPMPDDQTRMTRLNCPINIVLTASDGCDGNHPLQFSLETLPTLGTLCGEPPNLTYDPHTVGTDSFTFKVSDGVHEAVGTVIIEVRPNGGFWADPRPELELAQLLAGVADTVANVTYTGAIQARGVFGGGISAGLPFDTGVILSSGDIRLADVPNQYYEAPAGADASVPWGGGGDDDLDDLLDPLESEAGVPQLDTVDAAVLEFDLTPSSSVLQFDYVFASEEYPEFLDNLKNDAIAIFVNGQNIAWVPGTTDPVCVLTVHSGRNWEYFRNNPPNPNQNFNLSYDGFTSSLAHPWLSASTTVQPGVPVHVKIVIADEDDPLYDSAVFIRAKRPLDCAPPCQ